MANTDSPDLLSRGLGELNARQHAQYVVGKALAGQSLEILRACVRRALEQATLREPQLVDIGDIVGIPYADPRFNERLGKLGHRRLHTILTVLGIALLPTYQ